MIIFSGHLNDYEQPIIKFLFATALRILEKTMYTANNVHVYDVNLFHQR